VARAPSSRIESAPRARSPLKRESVALALALGGGGARAAYQAGVLRSLSQAFPELHVPILTGVSAGAINTAFLANSRGDLRAGVEQVVGLWKTLTVDRIFRSDPVALAGNALRWGVRLIAGGGHLTPPTRGLVNTRPLRRFLSRALETRDGSLRGAADNIRRGRLKAVALTTTNYTTEQSITWAQGKGLTMWERPMRRSVPTSLTIDHVMASCALPLFFPAIKLDGAWHGDGGVCLTAPLSPALHLGADRILAISTRYRQTRPEANKPATNHYPPPATVIGVLLNAVFVDMLDYDALVMQRINALLRGHADERRTGLRVVDLLVLRPSQDLEALAGDYETKLPRFFRYMVRGLGTRETRRPDLLATILFAPEYIRRVIEIGERDGERRLAEIATFLGFG
jgi:NTE family protein